MINICPSPIHSLARMSITFAYNFCHFKHNGTFIYAIPLPSENTAQVLGYDSSISFHRHSLVAIYYKEFPGPAYVGTMDKILHIQNGFATVRLSPLPSHYGLHHPPPFYLITPATWVKRIFGFTIQHLLSYFYRRQNTPDIPPPILFESYTPGKVNIIYPPSHYHFFRARTPDSNSDLSSSITLYHS